MLNRRQWLLSVASACLMLATSAQAELPADFQAKAAKAVQALQTLAADAAVVAAAKSGTAAAGMTNAKWSDVSDTDATVTGLSSSGVAAKLVAQAGMGKLILRDKEGNLVAFAKGEKPFLFNIANRPNFKAAITGADFIADKIAPDPSTQKTSVQVAVAVKDGGAVVGVLHASVE